MTLQYLFDEFVGKNVQVFTANDCFEGTLSFSKSNHTLTVKPTKEYTAKRFGPVLIDAAAVTAIRLVYIVETKKYDDDCDDSCETKV
jgi:hypothetical protein